MSEFISWLTMPNGDIKFLTGEQAYNTKRGQYTQKKTDNDMIGHSAIRIYYHITHGMGKEGECTDFSTPANFPALIVQTIKEGKMRGMGIAEQLLTQPAWAEYNKIKQQALAEYNKIEQQALAEYNKIEQPALAEYNKIKQQALAEYNKIEQQALAEYNKIEQQALAEYNKIKQPALAEYNKIEQQALAEYNKIEQPALAEYNKIKQQAFWDLFAIPENRNPTWR